MKKIIALMLTVIMSLSLFIVPAYADAVLPALAEGNAVYAGEQTVTIKLAEDCTELTEEQKEAVRSMVRLMRQKKE